MLVEVIEKEYEKKNNILEFLESADVKTCTNP